MSIHQNTSCDVCRKKIFSIHRYKCLVCYDFDLCANCYENKSNHSIYHPMQLILTPNDYQTIYFGIIRTTLSPISLTCPRCNQNGFPLEILIKHFEEKHTRENYTVLCPICFKRQNNLLEHLKQHMMKKTNENQSKLTDEKSLLGNFLSNNSNNSNKNYQRNLFIQSLLTDLFNSEITYRSS
jgi:hypothetical protein